VHSLHIMYINNFSPFMDKVLGLCLCPMFSDNFKI
jgi:hypothetical protein